MSRELIVEPLGVAEPFEYAVTDLDGNIMAYVRHERDANVFGAAYEMRAALIGMGCRDDGKMRDVMDHFTTCPGCAAIRKAKGE